MSCSLLVFRSSDFRSRISRSWLWSLAASESSPRDLVSLSVRMWVTSVMASSRSSFAFFSAEFPAMMKMVPKIIAAPAAVTAKRPLPSAEGR